MRIAITIANDLIWISCQVRCNKNCHIMFEWTQTRIRTQKAAPVVLEQQRIMHITFYQPQIVPSHLIDFPHRQQHRWSIATVS